MPLLGPEQEDTQQAAFISTAIVSLTFAELLLVVSKQREAVCRSWCIRMSLSYLTLGLAGPSYRRAFRGHVS